MDKQHQIWQSLLDPEYRREYSNDVGTGLAFQIKLLREKHGWTQQHLAELTGKRQETISQWENPDYGTYTLSSLKSLAAAFDVALLVRFAPFSELVEWTSNLTPARLAPPSFAEDKLTQPIQVGFTWATSELGNHEEAPGSVSTGTTLDQGVFRQWATVTEDAGLAPRQGYREEAQRAFAA